VLKCKLILICKKERGFNLKEVSLKVNGMMCEGCENRVQNVLNDIEGIEKAKADHNEGIVKITLNEDVPIETIKNAIEDIGYEVID